MCVGIPQTFQVIDTQKTDSALEAHTTNAINEAFSSRVEQKVDLAVQHNRDDLLNDITDRLA